MTLVITPTEENWDELGKSIDDIYVNHIKIEKFVINIVKEDAILYEQMSMIRTIIYDISHAKPNNNRLNPIIIEFKDKEFAYLYRLYYHEIL